MNSRSATIVRNHDIDVSTIKGCKKEGGILGLCVNYRGLIEVTNLEDVTITSYDSPGIGTVTTTCKAMKLKGKINSGGADGTLSSAIINNDIPESKPCTNNKGTVTIIDIEQLPYSNAFQIVYDGNAGAPEGRDAFLRINSPNPNVSAKLTITVGQPDGPLTCWYGLSSPPIIDLWNPDNPSRPRPEVDDLQGQLAGMKLELISQHNPPNSAQCHQSIVFSGVVKIQGEGSEAVCDLPLLISKPNESHPLIRYGND